MLDLSEEPMEENIDICKDYLERMAKIDMMLEMELGITGGEEDGVNNEDVNPEDLYTKPEEVWQVYESLAAVADPDFFTIAAAFGNVHGVYAPGNVRLDPEILANSQVYISEKIGKTPEDKPVSFVFHGGSGSDIKDIRRSIECGVIKMNIDTDTQYAFSRPIVAHMCENIEGMLKIDGEVGNKKCYDPRSYLKKAEQSLCDRMKQACDELRSSGNSIYSA